LPTESIDELRQALGEHFEAIKPSLPDKPTREADILIDDPVELNWELYGYLDQLEPYGNSNPQPVFGLAKVKVVAIDTVGKDRQHLKLRLASEGGLIMEAIGFGLAEKHANLKSGQMVNALGYLQKNQFNDRSHLQLVLVGVQ
jgi:single-stranded-DNA-specific exonuclease